MTQPQEDDGVGFVDPADFDCYDEKDSTEVQAELPEDSYEQPTEVPD